MVAIKGVGDILYESATIAYDTGQQAYINPQTGQVYGPTPPTGGWAISVVPQGDTIGAQALAPNAVYINGSNCGGQGQVACSTTPVSTTPVSVAQTSTNATNTTNTSTVTPTVTPTTVQGCDLSFSWDSSCIGGVVGDVTAMGLAAAVVLFMMMGKRGRG